MRNRSATVGPDAAGRTLAAIVASYVAAHPRQPELSKGIAALEEYLRARGGPPVSRADLERSVLAHWSRLEEEKAMRRREAALFTDHAEPRPVGLRHGRAFCPACGMFKDHRKECPRCGYLEWTR